ncbi:ABC transporter substrate-binding protein [Promicromonospora sp. NPDC019610]|uniref:ABC transporter substrate-binding protein n=1 Tax=Promicromonospora sp. NPDC019610 TaxID=3364405 RepID=UPI0037B894F3
MLRHRTRPAAAIAVVAALALSGCSADSGSTAVSHDLTVGAVTEPERQPDPLVEGSLAGFNYYYNLYDQLTTLNADGEIEPSVATAWTPNDDFTEWTFTLRDDVVFHNGEPLTAEDVAFSYNQVLATPDSDIRGYMGMLESAEATDDTTVVFTLSSPFSPWPSITTAVSIVPEDVYTELGPEGFVEAPVGSGPFTYVSWTRGVEYVLEGNDDYWGGAPEVDTLTFQTVADEEARLNGVIAGSLDVALVSPNQVSALDGSGAEVASRESNGVIFLGTNSTKGALKDPLVRRAIQLAIDKEELVAQALGGRAVANDQPVAPNVTGHAADAEAPGFDPEAAKELLAQSSYDGEAIPFEYATDGRIPLSSEVAQAIAGYLDAVGITVELVGMDQASLSNKIYGTVNMEGLFLNTWAPTTMDADMPATNFFAGGQNDYARSPETQALVEEQRTVDGAEREAVFAELSEVNWDNAYLIPLYTPMADYAVSPDITWEPRVDGEYVLKDVTFAQQ